jgi:hypothetical protein
MKNLFYGLLCFMILSVFVFYYKTDKTKPEQYNNHIIYQKGNDFIVGYYFFLKNIDSTNVELVLVYEIDYYKYNVGDTIK